MRQYRYSRHDFPHHHREFARHPMRRYFLRRFFAAFILFSFLFILAIIAFHERVRDTGSQVGFPVPALCGIPFVFILIIFLLGGFGYRRFIPPIADLISGVDSVANGDLSVRVNEHVPGEFGRLARQFNLMAEHLEHTEQMRRNLTADVAHELRTPIHIIQGNLEAILDGVYPADQSNLENTLEETHLLARLVEDLQTLSLAESGNLPLHVIPVSATDLLSDVVTSFAAQAEEQGVALSVEKGEEDQSLTVEADPQRMDQVLSNLVTNALKHTSSGGQITLSAKATPELVQLIVRDNGSGISSEDLPFIFDRFWRGDRARTRLHGSSGLGLAIAKNLVQAHGGTIRAESELNHGTTITIELPIIKI